jgi:hypothetical protein
MGSVLKMSEWTIITLYLTVLPAFLVLITALAAKYL